MAWFQESEPFVKGWGSAPQLQAPEIGGLVGQILQQRRYEDLKARQAAQGFAEAIKNVREERQANAYLDQLRQAGLVTGDELGGAFGAKYGSDVAKKILEQQQQGYMKPYYEAEAEAARARAGQSSATADYIKQYGTTPGKGYAPSHPDEEGVERAVGETWIGSDGKERIMTTTGPKLTQIGFQPTDVKTLPPQAPPSDTQINALVKGYGLDRADIAGGQHQGFKGGEPLPAGRPWEEADEIEITPRSGAPAVRIPISVFKELKTQIYGTEPATTQPQAMPSATPATTPPPADKNLAPGYGVNTAQLRQSAIEILKANRMPVTEANITMLLKQMTGE